jgi:hypothetical protein
MPMWTMPDVSVITPPHHHRPLGDPLLRDWQRRCADDDRLGPTLRAAGFIPFRGTPGRTADRTTEEQQGEAGCGDADRVLAELVRRAHTDAGAARTVLQRLLPGLIAIARRRARGHGSAHVLFDDLLANGWLVIRSYPVERRNCPVAAGLLRDIEYRTFAAWRRRAAHAREVPTALCEEDLPCAPDLPHPFDEAVRVLREARDAGLTEDDLRFAAALASGTRASALGAVYGVSARAARYRRERVLAALRSALTGAAP